MPKKTYDSLPDNYYVCQHGGCPKAATCLHQLAYPVLMKKKPVIRLINPELCQPTAECRYYRDAAPVTYARGFTNFQERMYPNQYRTFMWMLIGKFGRNAYYERRRGDTLLSPQEQKIVLDALRKVGITGEVKFDSYEKHINWYD